jgi:predicted ATPase
VSSRRQVSATASLPVQLTSFLGREREVRQLTLALRTSRLVTVTGTGGCGKTRLALQCAAESTGSPRDATRWVELGPLSDGVLVGLAVAGVLGLQKEPGRPIALTLVEQLQHCDVLLVLEVCDSWSRAANRSACQAR